jgi:transcriptional regulator with XRE-family HTH domain
MEHHLHTSPYKALGAVLLGALGDRTQRWLADELCVSVVAANHWVNGQRRPTPAHLGQIAALLNLSPDGLSELANYETDPDAHDKVHRAWRISRSALDHE